jgi:hypothetical protein
MSFLCTLLEKVKHYYIGRTLIIIKAEYRMKMEKQFLKKRYDGMVRCIKYLHFMYEKLTGQRQVFSSSCR